jgi:hypothetical protein
MIIYLLQYGYNYEAPWTLLFLNERRAEEERDKLRDDCVSCYDYVGIHPRSVNTEE